MKDDKSIIHGNETMIHGGAAPLMAIAAAGAVLA